MPKLVEIRVMPLGRWFYRGRPFDVTDVHVHAATNYFDSVRRSNGQLIPFDYEHQSVRGETAPAAGWIHELRAKAGDGLYALVEWTRRAAEYIREKEYKYFSPVLAFNVQNEKTGEPVLMKLLSVALTNNPFLPEVQEVTLKAIALREGITDESSLIMQSFDLPHIFSGATSMDLQQIVEQLKQLLGLAPETPATEVTNKVKTIMQAAEALGAGGAAGTSPEAAMQEAAVAMTVRGELATILGAKPEKDALTRAARGAAEALALRADLVRLLDVADDRTTIMSRIAELRSGADPDKYVPLSKFQSLEKRLAERDADEFLRENARRIPPADREKYKDFFLKDPEMTRTMVASLPESIKANPINPAGEETSSVALTAEERELCRITGRDEKEFLELKKSAAQ